MESFLSSEVEVKICGAAPCFGCGRCFFGFNGIIPTPIEGEPRLFSRDGVRGGAIFAFAAAGDRPRALFAEADRTFCFCSFPPAALADDAVSLLLLPPPPIGLNDREDEDACADLLRDLLCFRGPRFDFETPPLGISWTNLPVKAPSTFLTGPRATGGAKNDCGRSRLLIGITVVNWCCWVSVGVGWS